MIAAGMLLLFTGRGSGGFLSHFCLYSLAAASPRESPHKGDSLLIFNNEIFDCIAVRELVIFPKGELDCDINFSNIV